MHKSTKDISGKARVQGSNLWLLGTALGLKNTHMRKIPKKQHPKQEPVPDKGTQASRKKPRPQGPAPCPLAGVRGGKGAAGTH